MAGRNRQLKCVLVLLVTAALPAFVNRPVTGEPIPQRQGLDASLGARDLAALVNRCGGAEPLDESLELVRKHAFGRGRSGAGAILAFEENRWFVYALADMSQERGAGDGGEPEQTDDRLRRVFLLKPSTLVVEDVIRASGADAPIRWTLRSDPESKIEEGRFRVMEGGTEIIGDTLLPPGATLKKTTRRTRDDGVISSIIEVSFEPASREIRFLHVFHIGRAAGEDSPARPRMVSTEGGVELTVAVQQRVFRLSLPSAGSAAGTIEIVAAEGTELVPCRLLPSGVMPHGPQGARLMERWDAPYRRDRLPGWDVGRPCTHLVQAVEDKTFKPGRAIVFGCGSGTNAIYLASRGFEVTGVDVSPAALAIASKKARRAGVQVDWILADVVALPPLEPYDLIFDRGCYHHVCQYDSPGFVKSLRRLSKAGTRVMILAGRPADGNRGGPPRIKEETIRRDFSTLFDVEWLRHIHFDSRNPNARGASAWSIHLRRKDD
jgi:SAM-dependent methyltransferase